ncbi:MAG: hypothetical protein B7Y53_04800 [Halothiobacillus sp. 28-55-5]|nr:MAG: hypothetical protein B7Y53_04800 [Halothiobacillus sp. 28-55-5]
MSRPPQIWAAERDQSKASIARERFEFRNERLERIKAERDAALNKKRQNLATNTAALAARDIVADSSDDAFGTYQPEPISAPQIEGGSEPVILDSAVDAARARAKARRASLDAARAEQAQAQIQTKTEPTQNDLI